MIKFTYKVEESIIPLDYGKVVIELDKILLEKGISRSSLKKATRLDTQVINRLFKQTSQRIDLDVLARICYAIDCDISDILKYESSK